MCLELQLVKWRVQLNFVWSTTDFHNSFVQSLCVDIQGLRGLISLERRSKQPVITEHCLSFIPGQQKSCEDGLSCLQPDLYPPFHPRVKKEKLSFSNIPLQSELGVYDIIFCTFLSPESTKPTADPNISRHSAMEAGGSYTRVRNGLWSQITHWTQCWLVGCRWGFRHLCGSSPMRPRGVRLQRLVFIRASPSSRAAAWAGFDRTKINTDTQHLLRAASEGQTNS